MNVKEKYIRQYLRSNCEGEDIISPDINFVCSDGIIFAHKFMVLGFIPELQQLLPGLCQKDTKIILADINKAEVAMARDFLYMFGDLEPFVRLFGGKTIETARMKKNLGLSGGEMEVEQIEMKENKIPPNTKQNILKSCEQDKYRDRDTKWMISSVENTSTAGNDITGNLGTSLEITEFNLAENQDMTINNGAGNTLTVENYVVEEVIENKKKNNSSTAIISCSECEYKTCNKGNFNHHLETHLKLTYTCDQCNFTGKNARSFKFHQLKHSVGKFSCHECDFKGITNAILRNHTLRKHKGYKGLRNKCDLCDYTSVTKMSMQEHYTGVHQGIKQCCDKCDYSTVSKAALKNHIEVKHIGVRFPCKFCEFLSSTKNSVNRHTALKHKDFLTNE